MSCQHGNSIGHCDICDEVDAAWKAGEASGKRSAEHCTCPACRITHTNCCAVHNMPAMPIGHCDCGAIPPQPVRSVSDEDVLTIEQVREGIVGFVKECARRSIREPIQEANCKNLAGTFESWIKAIDHHFAQSHGVAGAVKSDEADSGRVWNSAVIREVIGELRLEAPKRPSAHYLADKLESAAATQEKQS